MCSVYMRMDIEIFEDWYSWASDSTKTNEIQVVNQMYITIFLLNLGRIHGLSRVVSFPNSTTRTHRLCLRPDHARLVEFGHKSTFYWLTCLFILFYCHVTAVLLGTQCVCRRGYEGPIVPRQATKVGQQPVVNTVVLQQPAVATQKVQSFTGHFIFSCIVFFCCPQCGFFALVLAGRFHKYALFFRIFFTIRAGGRTPVPPVRRGGGTHRSRNA